MRVFVTGATGFVGSHVVQELLREGHQVLGLSRSDAGDAALAEVGAEVVRGDLKDIEGLKRGAADADGVLHLAFDHGPATFMQNFGTDRDAIEALGAVLAGSDRPLIVTTGLAGLAGNGELATEESVVPPDFPFPRVSEQTALELAEKGVRASVMRLPQVHDPLKQGLITYAIQTAREKGVSAYVGAGTNRWAAAHVDDVARLYRLALEKSEAGARYHAVDEEGVLARDIAETIARGLNVPVQSIPPEDAVDYFGWWGAFAGHDLLASSAITRQKLGWHPTGVGLLADLERMQY